MNSDWSLEGMHMLLLIVSGNFRPYFLHQLDLPLQWFSSIGTPLSKLEFLNSQQPLQNLGLEFTGRSSGSLGCLRSELSIGKVQCLCESDR